MRGIRPITHGVATAILLTWAAPLAADGVKVKVASGEVKSFQLSVSQHYRVKHSEVVTVRTHVSDNEVPVVFYLAQHARVPPGQIMKLRRNGRSWMDICLYYQLSPGIFYVSVDHIHAHPYGHAYGYYRKPRSQWHTIRLSDAELTHMVNVKFLAKHHGVRPGEVIRLHSSGGSFVKLNGRVKAHKTTTIKVKGASGASFKSRKSSGRRSKFFGTSSKPSKGPKGFKKVGAGGGFKGGKRGRK